MNKNAIIIIGGGARGLYFTNILEKTLNVKVKAIVDNFEEANIFIEKRLEKEEIKDVEIFNHLLEALDKYPSDQVDGAFIMTPEWTHKEIFEELVKRDYNIFLEKPVATLEEDAKHMYELAKNYNKVVQIGFVLRYSLFYRKIKELVDANTIGKIVMMQMNERLTLQHGAKFKRSWHSKVAYTGGFLNEKCSHDLDLLRWIKEKQAQPVKIVSYGNRAFCLESIGEEKCIQCTKEQCPYRDELSTYDKYYDNKVYLDSTAHGVGKCVYGIETDIKDNQSVIMIFDDGSHATFSAISMSGMPGRDICIHGVDGIIYGNLEDGSITYKQYLTGKAETIELNQLDSHGGGDVQVVQEFLACTKAEDKPVSTVKDGVMATLMALLCDKSSEELVFHDIEVI